MPIIEPLRPIRDRLTSGEGPGDRLIVGPKGGLVSTATLRDATHWYQLVNETALSGLVRHGLRHTALTWMADTRGPLYVLQRSLGIRTGRHHPLYTPRHGRADRSWKRIFGLLGA
jgi:integrase